MFLLVWKAPEGLKSFGFCEEKKHSTVSEHMVYNVR